MRGMPLPCRHFLRQEEDTWAQGRFADMFAGAVFLPARRNHALRGSLGFMKKTLAFALILTLAAPAFGLGEARAEGFSITQWSARGMALGNGMAGRADDPSAVAYNPAGITQLPGTQLMLGTVIERPTSRISGEWTNIMAGQSAYSSTSIEQKTWVIPHFYVTHQMSDSAWLGVGVFSRAGLGNGYPDSWPGSSGLVNVRLQTLTINPNIAFKVTDRLSLALGAEVTGADMELNAHTRVLPTLQRGIDSHGTLKGRGYALSGNLALHYAVNDQWRVGFAYRSRMDLKVTGTNRWSQQVKHGALGGRLPYSPMQDSSLHGTIHLPDHFALGVNYRPNEQWSFEAGVTYFVWSAYKRLDIHLEAPVNGLLTEGAKQWHDNWGFNISAEYKPLDWLALRLGYVYETSPLNEGYADFIAPTTGRQYFTGGVGFLWDQWALDLGYAYIRVRDVMYRNTEVRPYVFNGRSHRSHAHSMSASLSYTF